MCIRRWKKNWTLRCICVYCKLCILSAILGITGVVFYLKDKWVFCRTQEVQRNLLPDISVFETAFWADISPPPSSSLYGTTSSSGWALAPYTTLVHPLPEVESLFPSKTPSICHFSKHTLIFSPLIEAMSNIKSGTVQTFSQHREMLYIHFYEATVKEITFWTQTKTCHLTGNILLSNFFPIFCSK